MAALRHSVNQRRLGCETAPKFLQGPSACGTPQSDRNMTCLLGAPMTGPILFVDDDEQVLRAIDRSLSDDFEIHTAAGGKRAMEMLKETNYSVIVADMRMPEINGAKLLKYAFENFPRAVRLLLTGQSDIADATAAVNDGHIFRLLSKPCPTSVLAQELRDALKHCELQNLERRLLEETVQGTIKVMCDVLAIVNPVAFGRAHRIRKLVAAIAEQFKLESKYEVEVAALLSQLGCISVSQSILEKVCQGQMLSAEEQFEFERHPQVGQQLLESIPRMGPIARVIGDQNKNQDGSGFPGDERSGYEIPLSARILHVAIDYDRQCASGQASGIVLARMARRRDLYDVDIVDALAQATGDIAAMDLCCSPLP